MNAELKKLLKENQDRLWMKFNNKSEKSYRWIKKETRRLKKSISNIDNLS